MLKQRVITALILLALILGAIFYLSTPWFALAIAIPVGLGAWEWANIMGVEDSSARFPYIALILVSCGLVYWLRLDFVLYLSCLWWAAAVWLVKAYPGVQNRSLNRSRNLPARRTFWCRPGGRWYCFTVSRADNGGCSM